MQVRICDFLTLKVFNIFAADISDISRRMEENFVSINYAQNGNDEDEFQDAD